MSRATALECKVTASRNEEHLVGSKYQTHEWIERHPSFARVIGFILLEEFTIFYFFHKSHKSYMPLFHHIHAWLSI